MTLDNLHLWIKFFYNILNMLVKLLTPLSILVTIIQLQDPYVNQAKKKSDYLIKHLNQAQTWRSGAMTGI